MTAPTVTAKARFDFGYIAAKNSATQLNPSIDAVFFQAPVIKGISGAPIISRDSGHVIAIQSEKLAPIGPALYDVEKRLTPAPNTTSGGVSYSGVNLTDTTRKLIEVLDRHLVNGLGVATGIDDASHCFKQVKREYERQHSKR